MNRLNIVQSIVLFTLSTTLFASDIRTDLRQLTEGMKYENCVENMDRISSIIENLKVEDYQNEIKVNGHNPLLDELFGFKITIHNKLRDFHATTGIEKACSDSTRLALRSIRTTEDYISEHQYRNFKDTLKYSDNSFDEGNIHVRRNPEFIGFDLKKDLKSGDIILTKGNVYTSAAIASLGEFDTQFSHMSIVYRAEDGELWTVEAHIATGNFVRPIKDHINDKSYRTMVFRYDDSEVAHKAAEFIFNKVKTASDTTGNILYDFTFDQDNNDTLFCSEVISYAYSHVTDGKVQLPLFRSRLLDRKPEFVKMLGITAKESFVPADIEVDPRFKIVSEWRNAATTIDNLQKDAVLQAMFHWNDKYNYQMVQASSVTSLVYMNIVFPLRKVPPTKYFSNISKDLIGYFGVLESTGKLLQAELKKKEKKALSERGIVLFKSEKYEILDQFRLQDLQSEDKKLHKMYRPVENK